MARHKVLKEQQIGVVAKLAIHYKDWEYAEQQYRYTNKTVSIIADEIGVRKEELFNHLNKEKVTRDLGRAIQDRTMSMLAHEALPQNSILPVTDEDIISINATLQAQLILGHRNDIARARRIVMQIMAELEYQTDNNVLLHDLADVLQAATLDPENPDKQSMVDKLRDYYDKVISMPGRVDSIKKLGESLKVLIALERQAFGIREDFEDPRVKAAKAIEPQHDDTSFAALSRRFEQIANRNGAATAEDAVILDGKQT